ncbi:hypothetical protein Tco_0991017 [Tanacetum coccineum]|uniref:Retrovirus-related Pol polyprotein from transposon TNT 1-94-like beta-barrel domain-containing protein n=1 Tax=Tanacetum coccineum TaxID=301880 RepID=A0ABQ5EY34_9ASTR
MIDYALWEVIENGATLPKTKIVEGVMTEMPITTAKEKGSKKIREAIEKRFSGNAATRKTERNLLKKQYENFIALSSEMLDQTFDRLQKLVSQLELLDEKLSQKEVNQKLLRSLSTEWNTHAVVWRNKDDLNTMSMDDLYNNLKVYEPEVKGIFSSSSSTQNMAFVSSSNNNTSSTNGAVNTAKAVNTAHGVSTASTQVNDAYFINIDNLSDAVICAFFASQPNSPQLSSKKLRQQDQGKLKKECTYGNIYFHSFSVIYGLGGYDWSDQEEEGPNYALMAFSSSSPDSEVSNDSICSKSCVEIIELLKSQNDQLLKALNKSELMVLGEITIRELRKKLEIVQKEKDGIQLNVDKFEHASKSLNKLIECQIVDICKKALFVNEPVVENCKAMSSEEEPKGNTQMDLQDKRVIDSGCSRHMIGNMSYLTDYEEIDERYVTFGGNPKGGKIRGKGTIKIGNLDFENVYFMRDPEDAIRHLQDWK